MTHAEAVNEVIDRFISGVDGIDFNPKTAR